jgi:ABC-2 type transport system ATP-binding protein
VEALAAARGRGGEFVLANEGHVHYATAQAVGREIGEPVQPGDDLLVSVVVSHATGIDDWVVAIQIDDTLGAVVYGTTTKRVGLKLPRLTGPHQVDFLLKDVAFGGGKYFVHASLMDLAGRHLHDLPQATSFNAPAHPDYVGIVHAEPVLSDAGEVAPRAAAS